MNLIGSSAVSFPFPPEFVSPDEKETKEYGLAYAEAIYNCGDRYGSRYFHTANTEEFDELTSLAQGNYSVDDVKKLFGFPTDAMARERDVSADFAHIDVKVLNLAPKYVNRAVAKMQKLSYDVGLQAIDVVSMDEKADYAASLQAFYRLKNWVKDMGYNPQVLFPDIDISGLPEHPDELLFDIATNPKIKKEISGELMMKLLYSMNRMSQKMREVDWDMAVYGRGHFHCYADENGIPRLDRINPKFWGGSYVDNDDFEEQEYAFFYDFITVNQFIKETSKEMSQDRQMEIVEQYANRNSHEMPSDWRRVEHYDGLGYIPVMRFYFRSQDNRSYVRKTNDLGRPILIEKSFNYRPPRNVVDKFKTKEYKLIENCYTSIYGGTWVIDSDCVYNYKRQEYPRQKLVNASLPIKTFATNFKEGKTVSFLAQMKEPLFMINVAWNKIKQILAEGRMGIMEIDFDQIENVALQSGGKVWTPADVMKLFFKKQILITRGKTNRHDQKIGNAVETNTGGLQLADYMNMFTTGIQMLEQMSNASVMEQVNQPDRLAVKNAELSQMTSDIDMEYLYNGHEYLYERVSHQMLLIAQGSLSKGKSIKGFIPALGKVNLGFFEAPKELAYCEYGMMITRQPGPQEWAEFYADVRVALQEGRISLSDSAYLRNIDNLKQARQIMVIREQIFERKSREAQMEMMQQQMQMNAQSAQQKLEADMAIMQEQARLDAEILRMEYQYKAMLQEEKEMWTSSHKRMEGQMKRGIAKQTSEGEILKKSVENIPKKVKNMVDLAEVRVNEEKVKVDRDKVEAMKNKPQPKPKK